MSKWFKVVPCDLVGNPVGLGLGSPIYTQPNGGIPTLQQDLIGNLNNYYPTKKRGFCFGRATAIGNVRVDLWEGPTQSYVFPLAPQQMSLVSTSANDTLAGTGIQKILIHYLDNLYLTQTEVVSMNGLTPVLTVATNILRINGMHAFQNGSAGQAIGNISLTSIGGATTYGFLSALTNYARQGVYTVPAGVTGYINHWQASSGSTGNHFCQIEVLATAHDGVLLPGIFILQDEQGSQNGGDSFTFSVPIPIPGMSDVKLSATADASNANVTALGAIMGWME